MALKTQRFIYTARNFQTGLSDITAIIRRNGTQVATGVAFTEIGNGRYGLDISPATLTGYGGAGYYDLFVNSATPAYNAPAVAARNVTVNDEDDIITLLQSVDGKIDTIGTNVVSVKTLLEHGTNGVAAIRAAIDALTSATASIQNNTSFTAALPVSLVTPASGSRSYKVPMRIFDSAGNLEAPDGNLTVSIQDESGNDRTSYINGFTSGPVNATNVSTGIYYIDLTIPSGADKEQLNFTFSYTEGGNAVSHVRTASVVDEVTNSGYALEATSQSILGQTSDIQSKINDANYGLEKIKDLILTVDTVADSIKIDSAAILTALNHGTYGLSAIRTAVDTKSSQSSVDAIATTLAGKASQASVDAVTNNINDNVKGSGFNASTDSLKGISDRLYKGGGVI